MGIQTNVIAVYLREELTDRNDSIIKLYNI